jgi:signal transduction histidine kinase
VAGSGRPEDDAAIRYTEVAVPIRTKSRVLGVLDIRGDADGGLDESDIFTLQTLADQVAVAIENARLYEAGQQLAVSEERNRLARDLHDSVTQELFSMTMMASALPTLIERKPEAARERAMRLQELARGALAEMRALLFALRPAALADEGLIAAVTKHAAGFESREGIRVQVDVQGEGRPPQPVEEAFYRVTQEALNNVAKHAQAQNVWLTLVLAPDHSALTIRDDGAGFDASAPADPATLGMRTMRERIAALGGAITVTSARGGGTTVHVTAPFGVAQPAEP